MLAGTRTVRRATAIMKAIAAHNRHGLRLIDLAANLPIDRATIYRIVKSLAADQLIIQREDRRYYLGQGLFELGLCAGQHFNRRDYSDPVLSKIAASTGDTVVLNVRSGNETVCIDHKSGHFPIKVLNVDIGDRRPLGAGAAGLAILSALPDLEVRDILNANAHAIASKNKRLKVNAIWNLVRMAKDRGYAQYEGDLADVRSIAVPILCTGQPIGAVSVTGITSRITVDRHREIVERIRRGVRDLERLMNEGNLGSWLLKDGRS